METNLKYFLAVARELNITQTAKKLYISQQSLSTHIKKLEKSYNTRLFNRKPCLSLTPAGEMLANTLEQIRVLEEGLLDQINSMNQKFRGILNVGISHSRASVLMPYVIPTFKKKFPYVDVVLHDNTTLEGLETRLTRGYLDMFIGITRKLESDNQVDVVSFGKEGFYIVISHNLMEQYWPDVVQNPNAISPEHLMRVPVILNTKEELGYKIYTPYLTDRDIELSPTFCCDDSYLRIMMCSQNLGATIVVEAMRCHVDNFNAQNRHENFLYCFPLLDLTTPSVLAYHKQMFLTEYARTFIRLVTEETFRLLQKKPCRIGRVIN